MQHHRKPEPYTVLEYQSREPRVFGVELRAFAKRGVQDALSALRWVGRSQHFRDELTFLVLRLPDRVGYREIGQLAECAKQQGVLGKLCFVVSRRAHRLSTTVNALQRNGLTILLGDVGRRSRFSDIADWPLGGVVIDNELVSQACGDPHAASILDAIVGLTANLGLRSFASDCSTPSELNFALSAGVSYGACTKPSTETVGAALNAVARASAAARPRWPTAHPGRSN